MAFSSTPENPSAATPMRVCGLLAMYISRPSAGRASSAVKNLPRAARVPSSSKYDAVECDTRTFDSSVPRPTQSSSGPRYIAVATRSPSDDCSAAYCGYENPDQNCAPVVKLISVQTRRTSPGS